MARDAAATPPHLETWKAGTTNLIEAKKEEPTAAAPAAEAKPEEAKKEEAPVEAKKEEVTR